MPEARRILPAAQRRTRRALRTLTARQRAPALERAAGAAPSPAPARPALYSHISKRSGGHAPAGGIAGAARPPATTPLRGGLFQRRTKPRAPHAERHPHAPKTLRTFYCAAACSPERPARLGCFSSEPPFTMQPPLATLQPPPAAPGAGGRRRPRSAARGRARPQSSESSPRFEASPGLPWELINQLAAIVRVSTSLKQNSSRPPARRVSPARRTRAPPRLRTRPGPRDAPGGRPVPARRQRLMPQSFVTPQLCDSTPQLRS